MTQDGYKNLVDLYQSSVRRFAGNPLYGTRTPTGRWEYVSYRDFGEDVDAFRAGLSSLGVADGDRVAVISNNRPEWAVGAYATYGLGACYVPMYETQNPADWEYILKDCEAKVLIAANASIAKTVRAMMKRLPNLKHVIDLGAGEKARKSYSALLAKGIKKPVEATDPDPDVVCGLIYTSGTTGNPKGVRLSHGNIVSNVNAVMKGFDMGPTDRSLSFLPWAHSFGQTCELHCGLSVGASAALCDDVSKLVDYLSEVRPTLLFSVPRIFNRIYDGLNKKMEDASPIQQKIFKSAMSNANKRRAHAQRGTSSLRVELRHRLFDKIVLS